MQLDESKLVKSPDVAVPATTREMIIKLKLEGFTSKSIADAMGIKKYTVDNAWYRHKAKEAKTK